MPENPLYVQLCYQRKCMFAPFLWLDIYRLIKQHLYVFTFTFLQINYSFVRFISDLNPGIKHG